MEYLVAANKGSQHSDNLQNYSNVDLVQLIMDDSYSLLPALTVDGIIYSHVKKGGYNGDEFMEWLEGVLGVMNPYPAPRSILILDNC